MFEHRYYGEIEAKAEGDRVWMTWTWGAVINRSVDDWAIPLMLPDAS